MRRKKGLVSVSVAFASGLSCPARAYLDAPDLMSANSAGRSSHGAGNTTARRLAYFDDAPMHCSIRMTASSALGLPAPTDVPARSGWGALTAPYQRADDRIAAWQLANTVLPYLGLLAAMGLSLDGPYVVTLLLAVPAAAFLARTFVLFHDCGHDTLFSRRRVNDVVGIALSLLVWEAFHYWRHIHAVHHATSSHLGRRGTGDYDTLTVKEYVALPAAKRFAYRVSRHPVFLFLVLPCFKFTLYNRLRLRPAPQPAWRSVPLTNVALIVVHGAAMALFGWREVLLVLLPVFWLASLIGLWLFYVQHQFEQAYWAPQGRWNRVSAALRGSSYYRLPALLNWFTANIGYHHVHHLSPRIPNYRLAQCHREQPALQGAPTLTLRQSLGSLRCHLWDEERGRMVDFVTAAPPQ
jgi:omega-6 fatty acid desaturase (delta-12 desaturase)